jgi:hypothetical protein
VRLIQKQIHKINTRNICTKIINEKLAIAKKDVALVERVDQQHGTTISRSPLEILHLETRKRKLRIAF